MLKQLRIEKHYTQEKLAKKLGISQSYLSKLENDNYKHKYNVTIKLIEDIANVFDVCPIYLFVYFSNKTNLCKIYGQKCLYLQNNL